VFKLQTTSRPVFRALLVGIHWTHESRDDALCMLNELKALVDTLGIPVVDALTVKAAAPQPRLLLGSGKAEEIIAIARQKRADVIVFDNTITPVQQRNWEKLSGKAVIDREEVILDIFAKRARTREARLQVQLACLEYSLPRLTRAWEHLSRQGGYGMGAMGAGETQLETDRRLVRRRIDHLRDELARIRLQHATRRKQRLRHAIPHVAIVGYTNAGKSSLFRQLAGEEVLVEDKLFATVETTTRKVKIADDCSLLLTDTVGFVRKLPHRLVESFKATLEEAALADRLVHVVDVSSEEVLQFHKTTMDVLEELGADMKQVLTVYNKVDLLPPGARMASLQRQIPDALFISAQTGKGIDELRERLKDFVNDRTARCELRIPQSRHDLVAEIYREGRVLFRKDEDEYIRLTARLPQPFIPHYAPFLLKGPSGAGQNSW
jgi:GTP-binding protein HflX